MEEKNTKEREVQEAWKRLKENQFKRKKGRSKEIKNVKTIFLFVLLIAVFVLFYLLIGVLTKEEVSKSSGVNDHTIRIEIRELDKDTGKNRK
jgi:hypothetical protein